MNRFMVQKEFFERTHADQGRKDVSQRYKDLTSIFIRKRTKHKEEGSKKGQLAEEQKLAIHEAATPHDYSFETV